MRPYGLSAFVAGVNQEGTPGTYFSPFHFLQIFTFLVIVVMVSVRNVVICFWNVEIFRLNIIEQLKNRIVPNGAQRHLSPMEGRRDRTKQQDGLKKIERQLFYKYLAQKNISRRKNRNVILKLNSI